MITSFFTLIILFVVVIGFHEAGHALAAWGAKVKIQRIALGFGRPVFKWQDKRGIEWVWGLWPVGGYVQLLNSRIQPVAADELPYAFDKKPVWIRCLILIAGALANLLTAIIALTFMFMLGFKQNPPLIEQVIPQTVAAQAGMAAGDQIMNIDGYTTRSWQEAAMALIRVLGEAQIPVVVTNQGQQRHLVLDLSHWQFPRHPGSLLTLLGIKTGVLKAHQQWVPGANLLTSIGLALHKSWQLLSFFVVMVKQLLIGNIPFTLLLGPIGLVSVSLTSFVQGLSVFLYFIASLSLAVGFVNLFPIPGLDGGSIVYALIEKIRGEPISVAMEILLHRLAIIWFIFILVQLLLNDLARYFV